MQRDWTQRIREFADAAEAVAGLAVATAAIRWLPFRMIVRLIGKSFPTAAGNSDPNAVSRAVKRAARRLPWRTVCFHEALAAHWMLRRRGHASRVRYGLRQGEQILTAHVWVTVGDRIVIGEEHDNLHTSVAVFPSLDAA